MSQPLERAQRSWREMADEASHERDPKKLIQLAEELTQALDERDQKQGRLQITESAPSANHKQG